ncbi:MAG: DUF202 domain-containing protein [Syntrophobacterales bacterium]|nr:DUF202 domain-containing protein [Syntrophobacterales bacterium]
MGDPTENKKPAKVGDSKDHQANERTFLAWIRTSVGIMVFGFVVEKFSFFLKELYHLVGKQSHIPKATTSSYGSASIIGIALVALGTMLALGAILRYKKVQREIDEGTYRPSLVLDIFLATIVLGTGIFFTIYMIASL